MARGLTQRLHCPEDCYYMDDAGVCRYCSIAGHSRRYGPEGCLPGPDCVKYRPREGEQWDRTPPPPPHYVPEGYVRRPCAIQSLNNDPRAKAMWAAGASDQEIAAVTGWAPGTVRRWRHDTGRKSLHRRAAVSVEDNEEEAVRLYESGANDQTIAAAVGCSSTTVFRWRQRTGRPPNCPRRGGRTKRREP